MKGGWILLFLILVGQPMLLRAEVLLVVGAPGEPRFEQAFLDAAHAWENCCRKSQVPVTVLGREAGESSDSELMRQWLASVDPDARNPLWIVLIGHGTFDGRTAKFNLKDSDVTPELLGEWIKLVTRPLVIINTSAASAPFLSKLSGKGRVMITATKSAYEETYAYFGEYLAKRIGSADADLDQDGGVSLLEAFVTASRDVAEYFESEGRIATEEALIDDNGDSRGTPASFFRGVRAIKKPKSAKVVDGMLSQQVTLQPSPEDTMLTPDAIDQRNALEQELFELRAGKGKLNEKVYYNQLEVILLKLANIYEGVQVNE